MVIWNENNKSQTHRRKDTIIRINRRKAIPQVGAKPAEPVNGQDERAVPAVDSPARLC